MNGVAVWAVVAALGLASCKGERRTGGQLAPPKPFSAEAPAPPEPPVEVVTLPVDEDLPVFLLRGRGAARGRMVFLHGMCTHGLGYLQAFQFAAASHGTAIALQGDVPCGGAFRRWSWDVAKVDRRIAAAFHAAGDETPLEDVLVLGYSQGASLAEALVAHDPRRYSRAILIGAPRAPSPTRLRGARAVVTMAGSLDDVGTMREGARALERAGVPSTFVLIPGARHGQMGDAEPLLGQALAFAYAH